MWSEKHVTKYFTVIFANILPHGTSCLLNYRCTYIYHTVHLLFVCVLFSTYIKETRFYVCGELTIDTNQLKSMPQKDQHVNFPLAARWTNLRISCDLTQVNGTVCWRRWIFQLNSIPNLRLFMSVIVNHPIPYFLPFLLAHKANHPIPYFRPIRLTHIRDKCKEVWVINEKIFCNVMRAKGKYPLLQKILGSYSWWINICDWK